MNDVDFIEKLKHLLLTEEWGTVSVYRGKDGIVVYLDGQLKLRMPAEEKQEEEEAEEHEEGEENE